MWEALLQHAKKPELSYWQKRDIARRQAERKDAKIDRSSRIEQVYDVIKAHPDGISLGEVADILGFSYNYTIRISLDLRKQNRLNEDRRKEVLSGVTHWRCYYTAVE